MSSKNFAAKIEEIKNTQIKDTSSLGSIMKDIIKVKVRGEKNRWLKGRKQCSFDSEAKLMWKYKQD